MSEQRAGERQVSATERVVTVSLDAFAWDTLEREAAAEGLTVEQLITFAALYYLADRDSGRIARQVSLSSYPD